MRKTSTLTTFLLLFTLLGSRAQLTPRPGATWLFRSNLYGVQYGEKWEYQSSSSGPGGETVNMKVTVKCSGSSVVCTSPLQVSNRTFLITGDKVLMADGTVVADFSLQAGDTTASPFAYQIGNGAGNDQAACDSMLRIPAQIINSGTETVNGQNSRYYVKRYLYEIMDDMPLFGNRKYSEYTWITGGYWTYADQWFSGGGCGYVDGYVSRYLECYYDNSYAMPAVCDREWFNKLGVEETDLSDRLTLYPNPSTDVLNIGLPETDGTWRYQIVSVDGKRLANGNLNGNNRVEVATLGSGLYFLLLENGSRTARMPFVKQ